MDANRRKHPTGSAKRQRGRLLIVRPKKPRSERKEETLRIRVTADQKRAVVETASAAGLDVSTWLRILALRAAGLLESENQATAKHGRS
jgi:hypothetical protein